MPALFVSYWSVSLIAFDLETVWPVFIPIVAGLMTVWDRAGIPVALISALALAPTDYHWWLILIYCIFGGILGDLLCYLLGHSLSNTESLYAQSIFTQGMGWRRWVIKYAPFVKVAPKTWCLFSRLFPAFNQWVHLALGVVKQNAIEHLIVSLIGNILWLGGWAYISGQSYTYLSQLSPFWKWSLALSGLVFMTISMFVMQRQIQNKLEYHQSNKK